MPEIELEALDSEAANTRAVYTLWGLLTWPRDDGADVQSRQEWNAYFFSLMLDLNRDAELLATTIGSARAQRPMGNAGESLAEIVERETQRIAKEERRPTRRLERAFEAEGGEGALRRGLMKRLDREVLDRVKKWRTGGLVLRHVWSMQAHHATQLRGGSSVRKAVRIIEACRPDLCSHAGVANKYWQDWRPVAHLAAAVIDVEPEPGGWPLGIGLDQVAVHVRDWLRRAHDYQRFCAEFIPTRAKAPLVSSENQWRVTGVDGADGDAGVPPPPLSDAEMDAAREYRAET
jgi:hypothetical protein